MHIVTVTQKVTCRNPAVKIWTVITKPNPNPRLNRVLTVRILTVPISPGISVQILTVQM